MWFWEGLQWVCFVSPSVMIAVNMQPTVRFVAASTHIIFSRHNRNCNRKFILET